MIGIRHTPPLDQSVSGMFQNYVFQIDRSENFNPISVRIFDECDAFHRAIIWSFHEFNAHRFKTITSRIDIGNRDTDMTETLGLAVTVMIALEVIIGLSTMIMGQF